MKKIIFTLFTLFTLFVFLLGSAQTVWEITNMPAQIGPGDTYVFDISYEFNPAERQYQEPADFALFALRELTSGGMFVAPPLNNTFGLQGQTIDNVTGTGTYTYSYTVPDPLPALSDPSNFYGFGGYIKTTLINGAAGGVFDVTGNFLAPTNSLNPTLSTSNFNKSELEDFSYNSDSETLTLPEEVNYSLYSIAGLTTFFGKSSVIDLSGIPNGCYILATEIGTTKIVKF